MFLIVSSRVKNKIWLFILIILVIMIFITFKNTEVIMDDKLYSTGINSPEILTPLDRQSIQYKINELDIDTTTIEGLIEVFGEPRYYLWEDTIYGNRMLIYGDYIAVFSENFHAWIREGRVFELRFYDESYAFQNAIKVGTNIGIVKDILGEPSKLVYGYRDLDDRVIHMGIKERIDDNYLCYEDKGVRMFLKGGNITALYIFAFDFRKALDEIKVTMKKGVQISDENIYNKFENDVDLIGEWECIDYIDKKEDFKLSNNKISHEPYMENFVLNQFGIVNEKLGFRWTKGIIFDDASGSYSAYEIRKIDGIQYMFYESINIDYKNLTFEPCFYVFRKIK